MTLDSSSNDHRFPRLASFKVHESECLELYGRKEETELLLRAYEQASTGCYSHDAPSVGKEGKPAQSVVLVQGNSGSGKTALVNHILRPLVERRKGYFLSGKFDCQAINDPLGVFVSALTQCVREIMASSCCDENSSPINDNDDCLVQRIRRAVQDAVGKEGKKMLTDLVPSVVELIDGRRQDDNGTRISEIRGGDITIMRRLQFVLCKFFRAVSTVVPVVLFFDDLQWIDKTSLDVIQALIQFPQHRSDRNQVFIIILAYRTDDVPCSITCTGVEDQGSIVNQDLSSTHHSQSTYTTKQYFREFLEQVGRLSSTFMQVTNIQVGNLTEAHANELAAGYLQLPTDATADLSRLVYLKSGGNALHTLQCLRHLCDQGILFHNNGRWTWNEHMVMAVSKSTLSIEALFCQRLEAMPPFTQEMLQTANCMGDEIDETALALVLDDRIADITEALKDATDADFILLDPQRGRHVFIHDKIRQAITSSVKDPKGLSSSIGRVLLLRASAPYISTNLCAIAKLLNQNITSIRNRNERDNAASLNLEAGRKAASLGAFPEASRYLRAGINLLKGANYWSEQYYDLSLSLFTHAADVEVCNADFARVENLVEEIFQNAICLEDKLSAYVIQIDAIGQQGNLNRAVEIGLEVLRLLGEDIPHPSKKIAIDVERLKVKMALSRMSDSDLLLLPPMQDMTKIAAMQVLSTLQTYAYQAGSAYNQLFTIRMVSLILKFGLVKDGANAFVTYGLAVCAKDGKQGHRFGQLALSLVEKTRAKELQAKVFAWMYGCIHHWTQPIKKSLEPLRRAQLVGMEKGDVVCAMMAAHFHGVYSLFSGEPLPNVSETMTSAVRLMGVYKQSNPLGLSKPALQYVHNLMGRARDPKILSGEIMNHDEMAQLGDNRAVIISSYCYSARLAFLFGDIELADDFMEKQRLVKFQNPAVFRYAVCRFTEGLIAVARIRQGFQPTKYGKIVRQVAKQLSKWARGCPENFLSKRLLLEAEVLSLSSGKRVRNSVRETYNRSIEYALQEGFVHEAALACELAGDYKQRCGASGEAVIDWSRSCALYKQWGAVAKEMHLRERLAPFLRANPSLSLAA